MKREEWDIVNELILSGQLMANVCWNYGNNASMELATHDRESMRVLQQRWDKALARCRALPKGRTAATKRA